MSLKNKRADMTPFDMHRRPCAQNPLLMPLIWAASFVCTRRNHLKIDRSGIKGLRPPYIVLATHQGFSDYYIAPLALIGHRANYVSDMEGFAAFGERLYRSIGCIGKRRFVPDYSVVSNIRYALSRGRIVVLYPESRHSNAGVNSPVPGNMGRLCKRMNVPVVALAAHGSYLANPFWDEEHTRPSRLNAKLTLLCGADEIGTVTEQELQHRIEAALTYDEYAWQRENGIRISSPERAHGLHMVLYRCEHCGTEDCMRSHEDSLICTHCGARWRMNELGSLIDCGENGGEISVPEWYAHEMAAAQASMALGDYSVRFDVRVDALPNSKGFIDLGKGVLTHDAGGFTLRVEGDELRFSSAATASVQTEYNYRGRGPCVVLSTRDCCFYVYSAAPNFNPTRLQFITEYLYALAQSGNKPVPGLSRAIP